jgi:hypothetical protein
MAIASTVRRFRPDRFERSNEQSIVARRGVNAQLAPLPIRRA